MFGVSWRWVKIYSSVISLSLVSKATGFFRDALITSRFGATMITDAYVVALLIPEILFNIFGNSLTANFAPHFYESEKSHRSRQFLATLFTLYLLLAGFIYILGLKHSDFLIKIFSSGFSGPAFDKTTFLLKIFLVNIFFITITYICLAFLQSRNRFLIPSTIGIFFNLAIIVSMLYKGSADILHVLIVGTLIGYIAQFAVQLPQAISQGLPLPTCRPVFTPEVRKYLVACLPVALLAVLWQVNIAMDNYFASRLGEGGITTLNLGYRVLMGVYSLLITNTMMIVHPVLSKSIVQNDPYRTAAIIQKTTNILIIILCPLAFYLFFNAAPLLELMFRRGAFTAGQSAVTAAIFQGYIIGLFFYAFRDLLCKYFYADCSALTPMMNGLINTTINFIYLLLLVPAMGLPGISLATALSAVSSCFLLYLMARKKAPAFRQLKFLGLALKIILASGLSVLTVEFLKPYISLYMAGETAFRHFLRLGTGFSIFAVTFCLLFLLMFRKKIIGFRAK